jgi:hypothetical protein
MIKDRRGDMNRRWMLRFPDFWLSPGMESIGSSVQAKSGSRFHVPSCCYDTNPWDGTGEVETIRHFLLWENPAPWEPEDFDVDERG